MNKHPITGLDHPPKVLQVYREGVCNGGGKRVTWEGKAMVRECEYDKWGKLYVVGITCILFS